MAALLAAALLAFVAFPAAQGADTRTPSSPSCGKSENDGGWGGSDVECPFACTKDFALHISVSSNDQDATVQGEATCLVSGDWQVGASCNGGFFCNDYGTAPGSGKGRCYGWSDEAIDSTTSITCESYSHSGTQSRAKVNGGTGGCSGCSPAFAALGAPILQSTATIVVTPEGATGGICTLDGCIDVVPECGVKADGRHYCFV